MTRGTITYGLIDSDKTPEDEEFKYNLYHEVGPVQNRRFKIVHGKPFDNSQYGYLNTRSIVTLLNRLYEDNLKLKWRISKYER